MRATKRRVRQKLVIVNALREDGTRTTVRFLKNGAASIRVGNRVIRGRIKYISGDIRFHHG